MLYINKIKNQVLEELDMGNNKKKTGLKSKTYEISKNTIKKAGKFKSNRKWYDYKGNMFLFPTIMYEKNIDLNVEVQVNRFIIGIGYYRWSFDYGVYNPIIEKRLWDKRGVSEFLVWAKSKTKSSWSGNDIDSVLTKNRALKRLIYTVGIEKHYIKIMLLREMIDFRNFSNIIDTDPDMLKEEKIRQAQKTNNLENVFSEFKNVLEK